MSPSDESVQPALGPEREERVQRIFSEIAPRYDLLNHVLSLNIDRRWRRRAVEELGWRDVPDGLYLDACAGTYDLSLALARRPGFEGRVVASDFARPMLVEGRSKLDGERVRPLCGDTLRLPFPDERFDGATVGFGVRNLADLDAGLRELARVLRSGGRLVILEFTLPTNPVLRRLYLLYFERVLPVVGRLVSGHRWAYRYLPASVKEFPAPPELARRLREAGFRRARWTTLTLGIAAIHVAEKS